MKNRWKIFKNRMKRNVALLLTTTLTFSNLAFQPVTVAASQVDEEYVKDVILYRGSLADAKNAYSEYEFVEDNMNEGGAGPEIHLGYQKTTNPGEAIRDLACMQMKGNYNTSDYGEILRNQEESLQGMMEGLMKVVEEFRENYYAGQKRALDAYDMLNRFYEEDTGLKMGDFFLEEDSEIVSEKQYVTLLLQANSSTISSLETILSSATDSGENLWIDRLVSLGDNENGSFFDGLLDLPELQGRTGKVALKYLNSLYGETLEKMNPGWEILRKGLQNYQDVGLDPDDPEAGINDDLIQEHIDALETEEEGSSAKFLMYGMVYKFLADVTYGSEQDQSLLSVFLKYLPTGENSEQDYEEDQILDEGEAFAIISSWTDGQRYTVINQGIEMLFWNLTKQSMEEDVESEVIEVDEEEVSEQLETMEEIQQSQLDEVDFMIDVVEESEGYFTEEAVEEESLSVYAGVDRSLFDSKIAMTCAASSKQDSTGQAACSDITGYIPAIIEGSIGLALVASGAYVLGLASKISGQIKSIPIGDIQDLEYWVKNSTKRLKDLDNQIGACYKPYSEGSFTSFEKAQRLIERHDEVEKYLIDTKDQLAQEQSKLAKVNELKASQNVWRGVGIGLTAIGLVLTVISVVSAIQEWNEQNKEHQVEYTPIPDKMVDQSEGKEGMGPYLYYDAVKDQDGKATDLNSWTSSAWLALYTTKSEDAGRPILAENFGKICYGTPSSDTLEMSYIHLFGEYSAQNLVFYSKNGENAESMYFFFERGGKDTNISASTFGFNNGILIMEFLILALGLAGGAVLGWYAGRKKEELI